MSDAINPKQILLDITKELQGNFISDTFEVQGHKYEMRLLTEEEMAWSFGLIKSNTELALALSSRLASLSVGIRSIDGAKISDIFAEDFAKLDVDVSEDLAYSLIMSKFLYDYLKQQPPSFIGELHECWQKLEKRRIEAQGELKNSSRESLEKEEKQS
jgi:hypothetical protein